MAYVLPLASLVVAVLAVRVWRRSGRPVAVGTEVDWSVLVLGGSQVAGLAVEGDELVVDLFGGTGTWTGLRSDGTVEHCVVDGTPMLTFKTAFPGRDDLAGGLTRLDRWWRSGRRVSIELMARGRELDQAPRRVVLRDGARSVSLTATAVGRM